MFKVLVPAALISYILALSAPEPGSVTRTPMPRMTPRPDGIAAPANLPRVRRQAPVPDLFER
jgi:hypothetical protein